MASLFILLCVLIVCTSSTFVSDGDVRGVPSLLKKKRQGTAPYLPTDSEQLLLEYVNRFRANPTQELNNFINFNGGAFANPASNDPDIASSLTYFNVNATALQQQFAALTPAPPLAWNNLLGRAAAYWSGVMDVSGRQDHAIAGYPDLSTRVANTGYTPFSNLAENIYAYTKSPLYAHAGWLVDWGTNPATGGIQSPPGHRNNLINPALREIGSVLYVKQYTNNTLGPLIATQDFGTLSTTPILVGVVYRDTDANAFYSPGEGIASATVSAVSATNTLSTSTTSSGGYSLPVPAGTYTVTITSAGQSQTQTVTIGSQNVKVDYVVGAPSTETTATPTTTPTSTPTSTSETTSTSSTSTTTSSSTTSSRSTSSRLTSASTTSRSASLSISSSSGNDADTAAIASSSGFNIAAPMWIGIIAGGGAFIVIVAIVIIVVVVLKRRSPSYERQYSTQNVGSSSPAAIPVLSMNDIQATKMTVLHGSTPVDGPTHQGW